MLRLKAEVRYPVEIGQVAAMMGVSTQTIRVWESKGLITPQRVGATGRRLYLQEDVVALKKRLAERQRSKK